NGRIVPTVIENQLSAARFERQEVCLRGVQHLRGLLISSLHRLIDTGVLVIPVGLPINKVGEISAAEGEQQTFAWRRSSNPRFPSSGPLFRSRQIARKNLSSFRIVGPFIQFFQRGPLPNRQ